MNTEEGFIKKDGNDNKTEFMSQQSNENKEILSTEEIKKKTNSTIKEDSKESDILSKTSSLVESDLSIDNEDRFQRARKKD